MKQIRFYRVTGSTMHIGLDQHDNIVWLGQPPCKDKLPAVRLRACGPTHEQRGEGDTFHVDGQGMSAIVEHFARTMPNAPGASQHRQAFRLFDGDAHLIEMYKATVRFAVNGRPGAGEDSMWDKRVDADVRRATMLDELTGNAAPVH